MMMDVSLRLRRLLTVLRGHRLATPATVPPLIAKKWTDQYRTGRLPIDDTDRGAIHWLAQREPELGLSQAIWWEIRHREDEACSTSLRHTRRGVEPRRRRARLCAWTARRL
jgi:hypothetical protein